MSRADPASVLLTPLAWVPQHLPDFAQTRVRGRRCHPTISASASFFSFCLSSFPASGSFPVCLFQIKLQNGFLHFLSMCAGQESPEVCAFRDSEQFAVSQPSVCLASLVFLLGSFSFFLKEAFWPTLTSSSPPIYSHPLTALGAAVNSMMASVPGKFIGCFFASRRTTNY